MIAKSIFVSKTFWFNVVAVLAAISESVEVLNVLPGNWLPGLLALVAVGNIILRTMTSQPVAVIPPNQVRTVAPPKL